MGKSLIPRRKVIKTSALSMSQTSKVNEQLRRIDQIKSAKLKRPHDQTLPTDHIEAVPLETLDSMIGYETQGDVYRNDLETLYDRIIEGGPAPEYIGPPSDEPQAEQPTAEQSSEGSLLDPFDTLSDSVGLDTLENFDPNDTLDLSGDDSQH